MIKIIDFSNYNLYFQYYIEEHNITFKSQKEADSYYKIWFEGFKYASEQFY